uniref:uncharacterized protein LOC105757282 n=1 Tax=Odobenus rosmarus divergens TaxID=9708 RepID=UPI00063C87F9|nr:PREDICTED: uncharacterized protein LOC105757282 [Odobenus rosmarus divergens]
MSISGRKRMLDQKAQMLSDHSFSTGDFWFDCYQAPGESPSWVKRGNWRKRHVQNDPASEDSQRDLPFGGPLGRGFARPGGRVRGGGREVLRQSGHLSGHSRPTSPCDPGPRTTQDTLPDPEPSPLPRALGLPRGSRRPPRRRSRRPRASQTSDLPAPGRAPARLRFP